MIKINLLPKMTSAGPADYPVVLVAGIVVFLACLGAVGVLHTGQQTEMNEALKNQARVNAEYEKQRGVVEARDAATAKLQFIEEKEKWVLGQTNSQREWGSFLTEIKDPIPQDCWLLEMEASQTEKKVIFRGRAFTLAAVANLALKIGGAKSIDSLDVKSVARSQVTIEQNQKEIKQAQERQKNTDKKITIPNEIPELGFATRDYNPVDFELGGTFTLKPEESAGAQAPPAPAAPGGAPGAPPPAPPADGQPTSPPGTAPPAVPP